MTTTMHFGPEWMRKPSRSQLQPSPPPTSQTVNNSGASTYSASVSNAPVPSSEKHDEVHPFRYSRNDMLKIYKEGGGKGPLGLEVERWDGVTQEVGSDPVSLRDMSEEEKKHFAGPLNSEIRRRQSSDYLSPLSVQSLGSERPRLNHTNSGAASPMRERFGALANRRRDSSDANTPITPRKLSLTSAQGSPRDSGLPSPRIRSGFTSGIDGVLGSGSDSWFARRRASEASKAGGGTPRGVAGEDDNKKLEIREEDEFANNIQANASVADAPQTASFDASPARVEPGGPQPDISNQQAYPGISPSPNIQDTTLVAASHPPGLQDLASVEWSYLDPQGQVQGPFRADLMQKWYDDGYFAMDLLMKRTHLDQNWTTVEDLARRSSSPSIFLSPLTPAVPPGLVRSKDSPAQMFASPDLGALNGPYQPSPMRSALRQSPLDAYLGNGSNVSDSPSSSFGTGRSPDPTVFGDSASGLRNGGFGNAMADPNNIHLGARRNVMDSPVRGAMLNNLTPGRVDAYGFNGGYASPGMQWPSSASNSITPGFDAHNMGRLPDTPTSFLSQLASGTVIPQAGGYENINGHSFGHNRLDDMGGQRDGLNRMPLDDQLSNNAYNRFNGLTGLPYAGSGVGQQYSPYSGMHQQQFQANLGASPSRLPQLASQLNIQDNSAAAFNSNSPMAWDTPGNADPMHQAGDAEALHSVATAVATAPMQSSPWDTSSQPTQQTAPASDPSQWPAALPTVSDGQWKDIQESANNLPPSNVDPISETQPQQDQQPEQQPTAEQQTPAYPTPPLETPTPSDTQPKKESPVMTPSAEPEIQPTLTQTTTSATATKIRKASAPTPAPVSTTISNSTPAAPKTVATPATPVAAPKAPWSIEDEAKKGKGASATISLREIQGVEAKKAEARKAAEREKERAARAAAAAASPSQGTAEDTASFTTSWGLPTSQAGARAAAVAKEVTNGTTPAISGAAPASPAAVWTAPKPQAKKTMKEIQEEEERRKKQAVKEASAQVATRRAYAESTGKATPSATTGGAWTTVGAGGKPSSLVTAPVRPSLNTAMSTPPVSSNSITRTSGAASARPTPTATKPPISAKPVDDLPTQPSHEFLKWLSDSLKGLNSSVNVEEIISMLLTFPIDSDASTLEIISDLIYANSTTLNGRRFATEFANKRKADAARAKGSAGDPSYGKPISIADVVKAQPKPTQPEWGGFKVVNKKKKGTRA